MLRSNFFRAKLAGANQAAPMNAQNTKMYAEEGIQQNGSDPAVGQDPLGQNQQASSFLTEDESLLESLQVGAKALNQAMSIQQNKMLSRQTNNAMATTGQSTPNSPQQQFQQQPASVQANPATQTKAPKSASYSLEHWDYLLQMGPDASISNRYL